MGRCQGRPPVHPSDDVVSVVPHSGPGCPVATGHRLPAPRALLGPLPRCPVGHWVRLKACTLLRADDKQAGLEPRWPVCHLLCWVGPAGTGSVLHRLGSATPALSPREKHSYQTKQGREQAGDPLGTRGAQSPVGSLVWASAASWAGGWCDSSASACSSLRTRVGSGDLGLFSFRMLALPPLLSTTLPLLFIVTKMTA